jgi:hypothetical protein
MKRVSTMPHSSVARQEQVRCRAYEFMSNAEERTGMSSTIGYKQNRR